jgi:hypothetical protein
VEAERTLILVSTNPNARRRLGQGLMIAVLLLLSHVVIACGDRESAYAGAPKNAPAPLPEFASTPSGVLAVAVGDLAHKYTDDDAVGALMEQLKFSAFITLGDNAYPDGALATYNDYWAPVFGKFDRLALPTPGNHDYMTAGAGGYKEYFSAHAPLYPDSAEYYAYTLGSWRWYSLNSEIAADTTSPQYKWLRADLQAHPTRCIAAYWHEPLYNAGQWGQALRMRPIWKLLAANHATLVLTGHDHDYQRWLPIDGMTQMVIGTGGAGYHTLPDTVASDVRLGRAVMKIGAVLQMALEPTLVRYRLVTTRNEVADVGEIACQGTP